MKTAQSPHPSSRNGYSKDQKDMEERSDSSVTSRSEPDVSDVVDGSDTVQSHAGSDASVSPSRSRASSDVSQVQTDEKYDVILIHGVRDNSELVWNIDGGSNWVESKLLSSVNIEVLKFQYDTSDSAPIFLDGGLESEASKLLEQIKGFRDGTSALLMASRAPEQYGNVFQRTKMVLFFNHPHRNRSTIDAHDSMIKLLSISSPLAPPAVTGLAAKAGRLADQVEMANHESVNALCWQQIGVLNVISRTPKEEDLQAVSAYLLTKNIGRLQQPFEDFFTTSKSHASLGDGHFWISDMEDPISGVKDYISGTLEAKPSSWHIPENPHWRFLLSDCPPVRASLPMNTYEEDAADPFWLWIKEQDNFKHWFDQSLHDTKILHVHGPSTSDIWADKIIDALEWSRAWDRPTLSFRFDRYDARFNHLHGMLSFFIVQLTRRLMVHDRDSADDFIAFQTKACSSSTSDLLQWFRLLCRKERWQKPIFAISCVGKCHDDVLRFLRSFQEMGDDFETRTRLIVFTNGSEESLKALKDCSVIDLNQFQIPDGYQVDRRISLQQQIEAALPCMGLEMTALLRKAIVACGSDVVSKGMILSWASSLRDHWEPAQETAENLKALCNPSPATIYGIIRASLPPRLQELEKHVSLVVQTAVHPLTIDQIAWALHSNERRLNDQHTHTHTHGDLRRMISRMLPGLYELKHGEVHFAHHTASCALLDDAAEDISSQHKKMAIACLEFLTIPQIREEIENFVGQCLDHKTHPAYWRHHFIEYSILHLAKHYTSAGNERPQQRLFDFFQQEECRSAWYNAHYVLSNPISRGRKRLESSILPIVARTGLLDLTRMALDSERGKEGFEVEVGNALFEAAHHGYLDIVKLLIQEVDENTPNLADAVSAAASFGAPEPLQTLIDICRRWQNFQWPEDLLHRVSWLGLDTAVTTLLEIGSVTNLNNVVDSFPHYSPLMLCVKGRHRKVAQLLLEVGKAEVNFKSPSDETALEIAACWGDPEIVRFLLENGADKDRDTADGWRPISSACGWGAFKVAEVLARAHVEMAWAPKKTADSRAHTPLLLAAYWGYHRCVEAILSYTDLDSDFKDAALRAAVEEEELETARILLQDGANPNITTGEVEVPLLTAVERNDISMVKLLIEHKADLEIENEIESSKKTALISAAAMEGKEVLELLLDAGADPNHICENSRSPLVSAAFATEIENVRLLLAKGADVSAVGEGTENWAPINAAYDDTEILKLLLEAGADINHCSDDGTVLFQAARWGYDTAVEFILRHPDKADLELALVDKNDPNMDGMSPLCIACKFGRVNIMRLLLEAGANARHQTANGSFPLGISIQNATTQEEPELTLRVLFEYCTRIDLQQCDNNGNTALHYIQATTPVSVVKALFNMGADLDAVNMSAMTPFLVAVSEENLEVCKYLLSKSANLTSPISGTPSALNLACRSNNHDLIKLLVEAGADVNEIDTKTGESPLYACLSTRQPSAEIVEYLVNECGADVNMPGGKLKYPIIQACYKFNVYSEIMKSLVNAGADINAQDDAGRRPIHVVHDNGFIDIQDLLSIGADPNARDMLGRTAVHYAAAAGNEKAVKVLLNESGVDVNETDIDGWTPLMWACQHNLSFKLIDVLECLISHGADISVRGRVEDEEWSPLKLARFHSRHSFWILKKLTPKDEKDSRHIESEDPSASLVNDFHESEMGWKGPYTLCNGCFCVCRGIRWQCTKEPENTSFHLCFRCYPHRSVLHPLHAAQFESVGERYEPPMEASVDRDSGSIGPYDSEA
ncbi:Ankyrin-2 [Neopestalotiopsis sp. 37M]|nr:Ankyrin-2 [Neopestalotiopsis sp. 37M]